MKDLLDYIVTNIVSNPDAVMVDEDTQGGVVNLSLTVDPADMGLIIGKGGQTIRSIRKILTVRAIAENVRVNLQLTEPAGGRQEAPSEETEEVVEAPAEETSEQEEAK